MTNTPRWAATVLAITTALAVAGGCGTSESAGVNEDGVNGGLQQTNSRCATEGATSECAVEIARNAGIISCAKGTRTCRGGTWGTCFAQTSSSSTYQVAAPPPSTASLKGGGTVSGLSISGTATACTDNPCDPYCKNFPDVPDAALKGDSQTVVTYSEANLTYGDLPNGNPPSGFVSKGNDYQSTCGTCYPASPFPYTGAQACFEACQFDSHCKGTGQSGCTMFGAGTKDYCTGIDVTTPIVCTIPGGPDIGKRRLRMCNRGSLDIPANSAVECWQFPGGAPQYPNSDPIATTNQHSILDTFNETVKAGDCVTHLLNDSAFQSNGTESVMCNVRTTSTPSVTVPSSGALPANGKTATTIVAAGAWTNTANALDTAGNNVASVSLTASTATSTAQGPTPPATAVGWSNVGNISSSADGASATTTVKGTGAPVFTAGSATAVSGVWASLANAQGAANATIATTDVAQTPVPAFNGAGAANAIGAWTNLANANGATNVTYATITVLRNTNDALWLSGSAIGAGLPDAAAVTSLSVSVRWLSGHATRIVGAVDLYKGGAPVAAQGTIPVTAVANTATFSYTAAQLAGVTGADVKAAQAFRVYVANTFATADYLASIDSITISASYAATTPVLKFSNFGLNVPANATINSVTVQPKVGSGVAPNGAGTVTATVYKAAQAVAAGTTSTTLAAGAALANMTLSPALVATDLTDANFAVTLSASASTATNFRLNVDSCTVTVNYTTPTVQTLTLSGFNLATVVPAGATITSLTTTVGWAIDASNIKATLTAATKLGATTLSSVSRGNPATVITPDVATYTNSGAVTTANLPTISVDLTADTTMNGFVASVDYVAITVTYNAPGSTSTIQLGGYGFAVPATANSVTLTAMARWSASSAGTRLCFQPFDGPTALNVPTCSTSGATPTTLNTQQLSTLAITVADANNLSFKVTATGGTSPSTASLDYMLAQVTYGTLVTTGVNECNIHNNWSVAKTNPPIYCPSTSVTTYYDFNTLRVFDGVCPPGTRTRWRLFGWDSITPNASKIDFRFRSFAATGGVCVPLPAISSSPPVPLATATSTPNTQSCSLTAPPTATCPANLTSYLGDLPNSDLECLQMDAYGTADPLLAAPTLNTWTATYDCLPTE